MEFTAREASAVLNASTATTRTLLSELRTKGLLVRVGRGRYKIASGTRGRYTVHSEPNAIHVAVAAEDAYLEFLDEVGLPVGEERRPHVVLRVVPEPCFTVLDGRPVLDRWNRYGGAGRSLAAPVDADGEGC